MKILLGWTLLSSGL